MFVLNEIVGGMFSSRLNMEIRENKGISYGVRSRLRSRERTSGTFVASGGIVADSTVPAVSEFENQLEKLSMTSPRLRTS